MNTKFIAIYQEAKQGNSPALSQPSWPIDFAKQAASALAAEQIAKKATLQLSPQPAAPDFGKVAGSPTPGTPDMAAMKGLRQKVPISTRYAANVEGYFKGPFGRKLFKLYDQDHATVDEEKKGVFQKCAEAVQWHSDESMTVYCPAAWDGHTKLGVYISLSYSNSPLGPGPGQSEVMDGLNMIFASPTGTSNDQSDMRRVALALDTLATIRKQYPVDETRIFVGGCSGGGAVAAVIGVNYPEFRGVVCQVRNFFLGTPGCSPYVEPKDIRAIARRKQAYVFVSGQGDMNYKAIKESMPYWKSYEVESTFIENDIHGHVPASAKALKESLEWAIAHSHPPTHH